MVSPYYGNSLYSGLAGNTHQPLQQIWTINMQAKRIGTELVPYIIILILYYAWCEWLFTYSIPFLCSLQKCMTRETDIWAPWSPNSEEELKSYFKS